MTVEIIARPFHALPCALETFAINGIYADKDDFGSMEEYHNADHEPYTCDNMHFEPIMPTEGVLARYNITLSDYKEIVETLSDVLNVGSCGWCA